jgi:hypothetical protein
MTLPQGLKWMVRMAALEVGFRVEGKKMKKMKIILDVGISLMQITRVTM